MQMHAPIAYVNIPSSYVDMKICRYLVCDQHCDDAANIVLSSWLATTAIRGQTLDTNR